MVGIADIFRAAIGGNGRNDAADTMRGAAVIVETVDAFSDESAKPLLVNVILPWAANVSRFAIRKWGTRRRVCGFTTCRAKPIGECIACHRPVCLGHAFVGADATLICWPCSRGGTVNAKPYKPKARQEESGYAHGQRAWEPEEGTEDPSDDAQGPAPEGAPFDANAWAYAVLGVKATASDDEVRKAWKKISYDNHPDRATNPNEVKARSEKLKMINLAYETIRASRSAL